MFTVPSRLILGHLDDIEHVRSLAEGRIHLFERAVGGFRVKEVDRGKHGRLYDCEDDIRLVADGRKSDRRDHDNHEIKRPICGSRKRIRRGPDPQGNNLGRVQPGHLQPADGEDAVKDEQESCSDNTWPGTANGWWRQGWPWIRSAQQPRTTSTDGVQTSQCIIPQPRMRESTLYR